MHLNPDSFQHNSKSLNSSWAFYNFVEGQQGCLFPTTIYNPNKAVITINAKTTEILVTNKMACKLLGLTQAQMGGKRLCDYLSAKKYYSTLSETQLESNGQVVVISGKVVSSIFKIPIIIYEL